MDLFSSLLLTIVVGIARCEIDGDFIPYKAQANSDDDQIVPKPTEVPYGPISGESVTDYLDNIVFEENFNEFKAKQADASDGQQNTLEGDCRCGITNGGETPPDGSGAGDGGNGTEGGGKSTPDKRVINGTETTENMYPWMTMLRIGRSGLCGAFLLKPDIVCTAAHCVSWFGNLARNDISLYFGCHRLNETTKCETMRQVPARDITVHRSYIGMANRFNNDIARIRLARPVTCTNKVRPVCLPDRNLDIQGKSATITGWGVTEENNAASNTLRQTTLAIGTKEECRKQDRTVDFVTKLCTINETSTDCQGDSGGPLSIVEDDRYYVVGAVSYGPTPCKTVSMYARIQNYIPFLLTGNY